MYKLTYNKIPTEWINGLPIGNGRLAAMYWGSEKTDVFSLNHEKLWRGKYRGKQPECVADRLPYLRELLKKREYFRAAVYANLFFAGAGGGDSDIPGKIDSFQPAGELVFEHTSLENNTSELDIVSGTLSFNKDSLSGVAFCDSNDGNLLIKWKSSDKLSGKLYLRRISDEEAEYKTEYSDSTLRFTCRFICGIEYSVNVNIKTDGNVKVSDEGLFITDANEIIASTNILLSEHDERALSFDFPALLTAHQERFRKYMERVAFSIDAEEKNLPIDMRIKEIKSGSTDIKLQELYFHYGRYLMVSSCVCGELPPNLQGKWNSDICPPWKSDYHLDINMQMNEWMIEGAALSEFAEPLADFLLSMIEGGRKAAKNLYGCRGIWLPIGADVWGEPTPESFGYAVWVSAAAWIAQPLWQHYLYTGDKKFLQEKAYKFFKEVALFYEDFLEEDENGVLQIMPSQSPENRFKGAGGVLAVGICTSSAVDVQLAYDALGYAIKSAKILDTDADSVAIWEKLQSKLPAFAIGSDGRLMEWNEEFVEEQPGHKHLSHLYGLYPSDLFTPEKRKKEYDAAVKSFEFRMSHESGYTGWSRAWISNIYARIGNPEKFYEHMSMLVKDFATESLLDIHPDPEKPGIAPDIFQIDGNFGMVSAVIEALCGYFDGKAHLLLALPKEWANGRISGIKIPGGHTISFEWENSKVKKLKTIIGFNKKFTALVNGNEILIEGNQGDEIIKTF